MLSRDNLSSLRQFVPLRQINVGQRRVAHRMSAVMHIPGFDKTKPFSEKPFVSRSVAGDKARIPIAMDRTPPIDLYTLSVAV